MNPITCTICKKTNHQPEGECIAVATFPQRYFANNVLDEIEKAHIMPVSAEIFSQSGCETLLIQLHGIKDIVQLESLYIESMCRNSNALTVDILTSKNSCRKFLEQLR